MTKKTSDMKIISLSLALTLALAATMAGVALKGDIVKLGK